MIFFYPIWIVNAALHYLLPLILKNLGRPILFFLRCHECFAIMGTASTLRGHLTKHKQSEQHILHKENDKRRGDNQTDRLNGHNKPRNDKKISKILSHKRKNGLKKIRRTLKKQAESGKGIVL